MRLIYFFLKFTFNYPLRIFYPRVKLVNSPKRLFGRTIYVSNHAASFMDPLVIASLKTPIIFFLTRADVFKSWLKPFFWTIHMLPIYRERDGIGDEMRKKNEAIFEKCSRILSFGRGLLIFGEGFTDDVFIRRLKPVKKGAVRIGFNTLKKVRWRKNIYIMAVGCNYSDPNYMRSDLLISHSNKICLNDYKSEYQENPNRTITVVTKEIERLMREQITHVENIALAPFHENIMIVTRKGMNAVNFDRSIPLIDRWKYSKGLADWLNKQDISTNNILSDLKEKTENYFGLLERIKIEERFIFWKKNNPKGSVSKELIILIILFPFAIIGTIQCAIPYLFTKRFVEKTFKRKVFWGSVKLILSQVTIAIYNIPLTIAFYNLCQPTWIVLCIYILSIGLTGLSSYIWIRHFNEFRVKTKLKNKDLSKIINKRVALEEEIRRIIPTSF